MSDVAIINPLVWALADYTASVTWTLSRMGLSVEVYESAIEQGSSQTKASMLRNVIGTYREVVSKGKEGIALVLWPSIGFGDVVLLEMLATHDRRVFLCVHDHPPLRRQFGAGFAWRTAARLISASRGRVSLLTHSKGVAHGLRQEGWRRVEYVPHPFRVREDPPKVGSARVGRSPRVLVLGQFKPARAMGAIVSLAQDARVELRLAGRGWPDVPGAACRIGELSEVEFQAELRAADVVFIPYESYSQSGVMVRAAELGIPVVGRRHEQLLDLWGPEYPGIVEELSVDSVVKGVQAVTALRTEARHVAVAAEQRAAEGWTRLVLGSATCL